MRLPRILFQKKSALRADRVRRFTTGVISLIVALRIGVLDARAASEAANN
jgi:hypothetical protein